MKRKMLKKWFALLLASAVLLMAAGCSGNGGPSETSGTSSTAETGQTGEVTAESILARDYSKKMTFSYAGTPVTEGFDYTHENEYHSWWADTFNVEWEVTGLTFDNWNERLNTWINADDLPDWAIWNFNAGDAANYVDQGLIKKLPDDWREKYPNLAKMSDCVENNAYYEKLYGGMYFLFRPVYAENYPAENLAAHYSVHLRSDWAEQVGIDLSDNIESRTITISEWLDYMRAVKKAGLSEYPWYAITSEIGSALGYISDNSGGNASVFYRGDDGKYHWGPGEEESGIKKQLGVLKQAYDEGLIYPEFYTLPKCMEYFNVSGEAATILYTGLASTGDSYDSEFKKNLDVSYYDVCQSFALVDDDGVFHGDPPDNYWACNILSPHLSDEEMDRILTIWDYGCTKDGQLRIFMGVPGEDWEYDEDGNLVDLLTDEYANLDDKYTTTYPIIRNMFVLQDDFDFINPSVSEKSREIFSSIFKAKSDAANYAGKETDYFLKDYSSQELNVASMNYNEEYAALILKEGDFSANYDQWVQEKMAFIQPVLDDLNKKLEEQGN